MRESPHLATDELQGRLAEIRSRHPAFEPQMVAEVVRAVLSTMHGDLSATETTLLRNRHALDRLALRPRVLRDVSSIDASHSFFGKKTRLPVLLAPIGGLALRPVVRLPHAAHRGAAGSRPELVPDTGGAQQPGVRRQWKYGARHRPMNSPRAATRAPLNAATKGGAG